VTDPDVADLRDQLQKAVDTRQPYAVPSLRYILGQHLLIATLLGIALIAGPPTRYMASAYAGPKTIAPLWIWGAALIACVCLAGLCLLYQQRTRLSYVWMAIDFIYSAFLISYTVIVIANKTVSPLPAIMYLNLVLSNTSIAFLLGRSA
jgi:hypothetical protein